MMREKLTKEEKEEITDEELYKYVDNLWRAATIKNIKPGDVYWWRSIYVPHSAAMVPRRDGYALTMDIRCVCSKI